MKQIRKSDIHLSGDEYYSVRELLLELEDFYNGHYTLEYSCVNNKTYLEARAKREQKTVLAGEASSKVAPLVSRDKKRKQHSSG